MAYPTLFFVLRYWVILYMVIQLYYWGSIRCYLNTIISLYHVLFLIRFVLILIDTLMNGFQFLIHWIFGIIL